MAFGLSLLSALGAGVLTTGVLLHLGKTETIVVSQSYLSPYKAITPGEVTQVTVPYASALAPYATNLSQVVGKFLTLPIAAGYPITAQDVGTSHSYSGFLTSYIHTFGTPGVLLSLPANSVTAGLVRTGERIALQVSTGQNGQSTLVQPIPVLGVLRNSQGTPQSLLLFVSNTNYALVSGAILGNNAQVVLIPQTGSFSPVKGTSPLALGGASSATKSTAKSVSQAKSGVPHTTRRAASHRHLTHSASTHTESPRGHDKESGEKGADPI